MTDLPVIDSHAHVWDRSCKMVPNARYRPTYTAPIDTYLRVLDAHGVAQAVLVQPSFLGTDNSYLLACLRTHPDRLRGIVVLDPSTTATEMDDLSTLGVIGLRYNLLSQNIRSLAQPDYRRLTKMAAQRNWWIEVQAHGADWPFVSATLGDVPLMADHFGRPSRPNCSGLQHMIDHLPGRACMKFSAPYRQDIRDLAHIANAVMARRGAQVGLWGSDWPWTQHEGQHSYADTMSWLSDWTTPEQRHAMSVCAPTLCGFHKTL